MDRREKLASLRTFISKALPHIKKGKGLEYLRQYKHPTHNVTFSDKAFNRVKLPKDIREKPSLRRGIKTSIGNTADNIATILEGTKGKGILGGTAQAVKNVGTLTKKQVRGDLYKEVYNPVLTERGGKTYQKAKMPWGKDKQVVGKTNRDSYIVRRRPLFDPVSVAIGGSGASVGTAVYLLGDKDRPQSERLREAATDAALFGISAPVGIGYALYRGTKKQKLEEKKNVI